MSTTRAAAKPSPYQASTETLAHLAHLIYQARPGWDPVVVRIVLGNLARQVDGSDLAVASIRAACDPTMLTPKAIGYRGPHWRDLATAPIATTGGPRCTTCGKVESRCIVERPGPDDHDFEPRP